MLGRQLSTRLLGLQVSSFGVSSNSTRRVSWKTTTPATPASRSPTRTSNSDRWDNRDNRRDSRGSSDRGGFRGSDSSSRGRGRGGSSRGGSSRGRGSGQQQQQQRQSYQRRPQEPLAVSDGAEDSWDSNVSNYDDYDGDQYDDGGDGKFLYPERPSKASYKEQLFGEALYGVAPIQAALQAGSRRPHVLLMQEGLTAAHRKDARALQNIQQLVADAGAAVRTVSKHELNMLSGNRPHQGLILDASPLEWRQMDVLPAPEELQEEEEQQQQQQRSAGASAAPGTSQHPVWLALDEVVDPQNLGAMLRSAYCLGASGVLACSRNCSPLTPVVSKASAGAAELLTLHSCRSLPRTLADAAGKGWAVVGTAAEEGATPVSEFKVDRPTVLVMGNEGYGLRATVKRCCTHLVQIEMAAAAVGGTSPRQQLVDSLNVSVATGILLHQLLATACLRD